MIEEPPLQQSRSRTRDQKISSPSKLSNMKNGAKSNLAASTESDSLSNNSEDLDFIEKIDLKKLSLLLNKRSSNGNEEYIDSHSQFHENERIKKIVHKFIKMKSFPVNHPQLITKLLQILQIIFRSFSDKIFEEKNQLKNKGNNITPQNSQDVKMVLGIQCPICEKIFRSSYYVDIHISSKHPQYFLLWQNLKTPSPLYEYNQNSVSKQSEEIEKVLKKIHKDLRKQKRNSSVSIEDRISNVEATMQNLGIINANHPQSSNEGNVNPIHRSRRHSFNSIGIASFRSNEAKQRKGNGSKNDENEYNYSNDDQNSHNRSHRHHHSKSDEYENEEQKPKSARAPPPLSVPNTPIVDQVPNSARIQDTSTVPQSQTQTQDRQQKMQIQASLSVPSTPSKIPKIPNLQLQTLKSQGQLQHLQLQLQPPKPQKPVQPNINTNDTENSENDVTPEPRRKNPLNSTATPSRRPVPKRKPASMNVPSVEIDNNAQTVVGQFYSPRLPDDKDDLNFSKVYKQPLSARPTIETVQPHQLPSKPPSTPVNPHSKRTIPIPSPKKNSEQVNSKVFSPSQPRRSSFTQASPFSMIQVDQDDDDDVSDEVHIQTGRLQKKNENEKDGQINSQKEKVKNEKIEDDKPKLPASSPVSVEITKRPVNVAVNDDDDDVPEEYLESVSSISSDSSELPEIDFKPKPKTSHDIKGQPNTRRKNRMRNNPNEKS